MSSEPIHLFMCGSGATGGLFALTRDRSGGNLPKSDCPCGWAYEKTIELDAQAGGVAANVEGVAAAADLEKSGYHLFSL